MGGTVMDWARGRRRSEMGVMEGGGGQRIYANRRGSGREMERRAIELTQGKEGEKEGERKGKRERKIEWANSR